MNKLFIHIILLLLLSTVSISLYGSDRFRLHGKFDRGKDGEYIMLFTFRDNKINAVDTTYIKNKSFSFIGEEYLDDFSIITYGNYPDTVWSAEVILERGDIYVEIDMKDIITGTSLNESYQSYTKTTQCFSKRRNELFSLYKQNSGNDSIFTLMKQCDSDWQQYTTNFVKNNVPNLLSKRIFIDNVRLFDPVSFEEIYEVFDERLKQDRDVVRAVEDRKEMKKQLREREKSVDEKISDFELVDLDGNNIWVSEIINKSKFLYIDFWASWCAPCIAEMPLLKKLQEKYKDKGLEILGVSIDTNKSSWKSAIKRFNIPWTNLCDLNGGQELMKELNFSGVPYGLLVDNTGRIIQVNLRGEALELYLFQFFDN